MTTYLLLLSPDDNLSPRSLIHTTILIN